MQDHKLRILPAIVAVLVHGLFLAAFLHMRAKPLPATPEAPLPITWIKQAEPAPAPLGSPGQGLALRSPSTALTVPEISIAAPPQASLPSALDDYLTCGVGQALTDAQRKRCDGMRQELYANPSGPLAPLKDEQRFARDKAFQDQPLLQLCQTRTGVDPLCSRGKELLLGSISTRGMVPLPLNEPVKLRSCAALFC